MTICAAFENFIMKDGNKRDPCDHEVETGQYCNFHIKYPVKGMPNYVERLKGKPMDYTYKCIIDDNISEDVNLEYILYIVDSKTYNRRIAKLANIISKHWVNDRKNVWNLAGFLFNQPSNMTSNLNTFLAILWSKLGDNITLRVVIDDWNSWHNSKYVPKVNIGTLKAIAAGTNSSSYQQWKDKYEPKPVIEDTPNQVTKQKDNIQSLDTVLNDVFNEVFKSTRIINDLTILLGDMGRTWDEFKEAMVDESFDLDELSYWVDKYCNIRNYATNDFSLSYSKMD